jgi:dolichyl-phosphate-mannose-protein mannosyltransferase
MMAGVEPDEDDAILITADRARRHGRRQWYARPFAVIAAVTALAGGLRFYHLSTPNDHVFDEVYYAKDGCFDAGIPYRECGLDAPREQTFTAHPPLGRWIIAGGVTLFGNRAFGWRAASAAFGTLSVLLVSILALRLFGNALWAGAAGLLLATESLNFVQSRISMLDIFLTAFVVAGFLFLVLDRRWIERRTPELGLAEDEEALLLSLPPDRPPAPIFRPWRLAAGMAMGAAVATKWSGGPALAGAILLALGWERSRRRQVGLFHPWREAIRDEGFSIFLFLVIVPVLVYTATYARWWADHGFAVAEWWGTQVHMADFHLALRDEHAYSSRAWEWILLARPVAYYYECFRETASGCQSPAHILGIGNQAIFWGSLLTIPYVAYSWWRRRDWRAGLVVVAFTVQYVPWFFAARTNFLFYMTPVTPFMVLAAVYALRDLSEVRLGRERSRTPAVAAAAAIAAVAVGLFVFFLPVLTGRTISQGAWRARMWFSSWI